MRVLMRKKMLSGDTQLIPVDVLSSKNGILRVKPPGQFSKPIEIAAKDTVSAAKVYGTDNPHQQFGVIQRAYAGVGSLSNALNK